MRFWLVIFLLTSFISLKSQECDFGAGLKSINVLNQSGEFKKIKSIADSLLLCKNLHLGSDIYFDLSMIKFKSLRNLRKTKSPLRAIQELRKGLEVTNSNKLNSLEFRMAEAEATLIKRNFTECSDLLNQLQEAHPNHDFENDHYFQFIKDYNRIGMGFCDNEVACLQKLLNKLLSKPNPNAHHLGQILAILGQKSRVNGDFEKAAEYHILEMEKFKVSYGDDHIYAANAAYNAGNNYYELGDYETALRYYLPCHKIWEKHKAPENKYMRYLNEAIGDMYWELGNKKDALIYFNKSVLNETHLDNDSSKVVIYEADSLLVIGKYDEALKYYEEALQLRRDLYGDDHSLTGACQNYIARSMHSRGETDQALSAYQRAICMLSTNFSDTTIYSNPDIEDQENYAIGYLLESLIAKGELLSNRYGKSAKVEDINAALETQQLAVEILEKIQKNGISFSSRSFWSQKTLPLIENSIQSIIERYNPDNEMIRKSFELSEKSKSILLLSALHEKELVSESKIPKAITDREQGLKDQINEYLGKVQLEEERCSQTRSKILTLWNEKLFELKTEYDIFLSELKNNYPEYYKLKYNLPKASVHEVQKTVLDENTALIEYFIGNHDIYTFIISKNEFKVLRMASKSTYRELAFNYHRTITDYNTILNNPEKAYRDYCELSFTLYSKFVQPALNAMDSSIDRLIIIPDDYLSYISFESLITKEADLTNRKYKSLEYLFKNYTISYAPSAALKIKATQSGSALTAYVGFAPQYRDQELNRINSDLGKLKFNKVEIENAKKNWGGTIFTGDKTTEELVYQYLPKAGIAHFAMHAIVNDQSPMLSKFLLNSSEENDGFLHTYEIYNLDFSSQLVILSACNTGVGQWKRGEGMLSLERAFQFAGCPSLLSTLWTVDDASTSNLMDRFLAKLDEGIPKDVALKAARLSYLDEASPEYLHPFYWSAFKLTGNTHSIRRKSSMPWIYLSLTALVLLTFGFLLWNRFSPKGE